ncbi:MAG: hypothetical protein Fur0016_25820 [Anaerolineales bacterium]
MSATQKSEHAQHKYATFSLSRVIGDLPSHHYEVEVSTALEKAVTRLKNDPDIPGVILRQSKTFAGALSRWKIFEWLGRPYGIELYFRKPIRKLAEAIGQDHEIYPHTMPILQAVQRALQRAPEMRYEPLVVMHGERDLRLLDMDVLLLAQSEQLTSANAVIQKQAEIGKILSSSLELPKVLHLILEQMEGVIPYDRASILLHHNGRLEFAASRGYAQHVDMEQARELANRNPVFTKILSTRQPAAIEDVSSYTAWPHIPDTTPTRSWLGLPLVQNDTVLGMLSISRLVVARFHPDEVEAASIFSSQSAAALGNARLFEQIQKVNQQLEEQQKSLQETVDELNRANLSLMRHSRQLETSQQIGQQITSLLSLRELLPQVINIIRVQFNYSLVSIWMIHEKSHSLTLVACTNASLQGMTISLSHTGLAARACRSGTLLYENFINKQPDFTPTPGMRAAFSEFALPLKFHHEVMGVLDIQSERMQAFCEEDVTVLQSTTSQIAVAIRNAMTYDQLVYLSGPQGRQSQPVSFPSLGQGFQTRSADSP